MKNCSKLVEIAFMFTSAAELRGDRLELLAERLGVLRVGRERASAMRDSSMKVGNARKVAAISASRFAVVANTLFEFVDQSASWPSRSVSASNTTPVFLTSRDRRLLRVQDPQQLVVFSANGVRLPRAS